MNVADETPIVEVLPAVAYASRHAVITAIGHAMVHAAAVRQPYVDGMLRKEEAACTIVTAEVALPHGTPDVRTDVLRNILVVAPIAGGVEWIPGKRVRLAIGLAGTGDDAHLHLLGSVARVLGDAPLLKRLKHGGDRAHIAALFQ